MAAQLPKKTKIISIERDPDAAWIAHSIHKHAGVANRIKIVIDSTAHAIPRLSQKYRIRSFDFIFIDHNGSNYLRDFMLLEQYGLIRSGTMIVADNVITPGAPDYLNYVQNNLNYKSKTYRSSVEYQDDIPDAVEVTIRR
jgi:catechol O-methyltransferase